MREKVRDRGRLEHILEAIESIEEFHASLQGFYGAKGRIHSTNGKANA